MTYKQAVGKAMDLFAINPKTLFVGYNVAFGRAGGTLSATIPEDKLVEMPLAENLMMSTAIGLAITGYFPVVYFERFDFIMNAMDAIVNHLDKMKKISRNEFNPCCVIRVVAGNTSVPLFTGATHVQNFAEAFRRLSKLDVYEPRECGELMTNYAAAYDNVTTGKSSSLIVEFKDLYDSTK